MDRKGSATRRLLGRAFVYSAKAPRGTLLGSALNNFVNKTFKGSVSAMVKLMMGNNLLDEQAVWELLEYRFAGNQALEE